MIESVSKADSEMLPLFTFLMLMSGPGLDQPENAPPVRSRTPVLLIVIITLPGRAICVQLFLAMWSDPMSVNMTLRRSMSSENVSSLMEILLAFEMMIASIDGGSSPARNVV